MSRVPRSASHTGVVFKNSWGGKRLSELLAYMTERMPKNSPGSLTGEEYAAVTAYILMLNGYPSGDEELPYDSKRHPPYPDRGERPLAAPAH